MVAMKMRLFEKIPPSRKEEGNLHQKLQEVREPRVLRPKWSHKDELQAPRLPNLGEEARKKPEGGKGISLKPVPRLEHRIRPR